MDHSPLARLPPELRIIIYELVLLSDDPIKLYDVPLPFKPWKAPNLLQCCRQLKNEASGVYYGENIFVADFSPSGDKQALAGWLHTLEPAAHALIRNIRLDDVFYLPEGRDSESGSAEPLSRNVA